MPKVSVTVRLPAELVERIHKLVAEIQGDQDWPRVNRTEVIETLLEEALRAREAEGHPRAEEPS